MVEASKKKSEVNESRIFWGLTKEIVEKRQGEPIKFLFLPKTGLFVSQASTEKKGYELWATFEGCFFMFSWAKI